MPYWQYKKLEQAEKCASFNERGSHMSLVTNLGPQNTGNQTTGITPMVEKNISFSQYSNPSPLSTPDNAECLGEALIGEKVKSPSNFERQNSNGKGIKRPASPFTMDKKKRTKSAEEENTSKLFQESKDWE